MLIGRRPWITERIAHLTELSGSIGQQLICCSNVPQPKAEKYLTGGNQIIALLPLGSCSTVHHLDYFRALIRLQLWFAASNPTSLPSGLQPHSCPLSDHRSLKRRESTQHLKHHSPRRGRRIEMFSDTTKSSTCFSKLFQNVKQIL